MDTLPSSIETYLLEAGFSTTELLVLKRLLADDAMTLRQLAAKTGKSTGVLDQAMKKLLRRNIVTKEWINDTYKYALVSLQSIVRWVEQDTVEKNEMLQRRKQNFESFINSLAVSQKRPDMQFFEGDDGIKQAYKKLLEYGREPLHFFPVVCSVEDDPLRDFRIEYFRERRRRGIFAKYIIHNTPLGRRFATRDPFEYRKSLLIPEDQYPISFEKVIVGDVVACINHAEKRACFIRYPELAETERRVFERLWKQQENVLGPTMPVPIPPEPVVPLSTRILSMLREFFLTRKSIALFVLFALASGAITYGLYERNIKVNVDRIREHAMALATTVATKIDVHDLNKIHIADDVKQPEFQKLLTQLQQIKQKNDNVTNVYIRRPTNQKDTPWEVVVDAMYGDNGSYRDINGDGKVDVEEQLVIPGQRYKLADPNSQDELKHPNSVYAKNEWGEYYGSSAPILDASGSTAAVLFVDMDGGQFQQPLSRSFAGILYFFGIFLFFVLIRLFAFNRSLFLEIFNLLRSKKPLTFLVLTSLIALAITYIVYLYTLNVMYDQVGARLVSIVSTAASEFDAKDLAVIRVPEDMVRPEYQRVFKKLNQIRDENEGVTYAWIMTPADSSGNSRFVADADTNFNVKQVDMNHDGKIDGADTLSPPGTLYNVAGQESRDGRSWKAFYLKHIVSDQWGNFVTANAPIPNPNDDAWALGVDMEVTHLQQQIHENFSAPVWFFSISSLLLIGWVVYLFSLTLLKRGSR